MDLTLTDGRVITLNAQQEHGLNVLDDWYASNDLFIRLLGYAGTGKTTIVKHFIDKKSTWDVPIVVTAPTHRAKSVIARATGREGKTAQALLGLGLDVMLEDFDPNKPEFTQKRDPEIGQYKIMIIDEGSMFNSALLTMTLDIAEQSRTRVIILCDPAQLPPVKEKLSAVITTERITWQIQLTHVERQKEDNPLMKVYDFLRNNLHCRGEVYPEATQLNDKKEGIIINKDNVQFAREMIHAFKNEKEVGMTKVLCFRNDSVTAWNTFLRTYLFGKGAPTLCLGEVLMAYTNVRGKIVNSSEYQIMEITPMEFAYDQEYEVKGKTFKITTGKVKIWRLKVFDIYEKHTLIIDIIQPVDHLVLARETLRFMGAAGKDRSLWPKYFDWRARFYVMQNVFVTGRKPPVLKKDLDYGYALTVHKSQGGTFNDVFVDDRDISKQSDYVFMNKMRYVALSRPRFTANVLV